MNPKRGAFDNSPTGYSKRHNSHSHKSANKSHQKSSESTNSHKKCKHLENEADKAKLEEQDQDLNSGFGNYLRSNEGVEMMKIFVFANTVMVIVTMAWPHVKEQYIWLMEWLETFKGE